MDRYSMVLYRLYRQYWEGSRLQKLWKIWLTELAALLPERWQLHDNTRVSGWPLAEGSYSGERIWLQLSAEQALLQRLWIPREAARNLHEVMQYELDKYTPFSADQVQFDCRLVKVGGDQAEVVLGLVTHEQMDAILKDCQDAGVKLKGIDIVDASAGLQQLNLLPLEARRKGASRSAKVGHLLLATAVVLAVITLSMVLNDQRIELASSKGVISELRQQVRLHEKKAEQLDQAQQTMAWITRKKNANPGFAYVLASLSACLPDDTWIRDLEMSQKGELSINGFSTDAGRLVEKISHCKPFAEPHFAGVIQPDEATGKERFSLNMKLDNGGHD